jgi:nucleoside-diphosphate-sugar epimerase
MTSAMRWLLLVFALTQLVLGLLPWLAPGFFFESIGPYGTRNDHYIGDLASWYLALGAVALVALRRESWRIPVQDVRRRRFPVVGPGSGVFSFIHVDDAAVATVAAVERGAPGVYNVVDDDPAPMREWLPAYGRAIGAKPPRHVPLWLARLITGGFVATMATTLGGASNAKAKRELEWSPRWASWREGFVEAPR